MALGLRSITIGPHIGLGIGGAANGISLLGLEPIGFGGQSNVQGSASPITPTGVTMARAITLATGLDQPFTGCYEMRKYGSTPPDPPTWLTTGGIVQGPVPLAPRPINAEEALGGSFGPSLSLGRYLHHSLPGWVVGELALGGTTLATNWKAPPGNTYPTANPKLVDQWIAFLQSLQVATGKTLRAIVWSHGTSDALNTTNANNYAANLAAFYTYVSAFFPGVPWIIEQISSLSAGGADLTTVRNAQAAFVAANPGVTFLVDSESLPLPGNQAGNLTHYNADGYIVMGRRYAAKVLAACSIPEVPQAEFRYFGSGTSVQLTDMSINANSAVNAWSWSVQGIGVISTSQNPVWVAPGTGTFSVSLTATSANGKSDTITHSVIVATNAWTVDATANIACPSTLAEENAFLAAAGITSGPCSHLWLNQANCQGSPFQDPDVIGGVPLGANGAFTSQSASASWTRVGNLWADGVSNRHLSSTAAGLPDCSVTPTLLIGFWDMPAAAPAATRGFMSIGVTGNGDLRLGLTTGKLQLNATANTPMVYNVCNSGRQFVAIQDTLTEVIIYTEQERFVMPRRTPASGKSVGFGGFTATSPAARLVYAKLYRDAAALISVELLRAYFRTGGWNPAW
jgi:PKD repeat protein